jgi:hypothetical protein
MRVVLPKAKTAIRKALGGGHQDDPVEVHSLEAGNTGFHHAGEGFFQADGFEFSGVGDVLFGDRW